MKPLTGNFLLAITLITTASACSTDNDNWGNMSQGFNNGNGNSNGSASSAIESLQPTFNATIASYDGTTAQDADADIVGNDTDLYWEANTFSNIVNVNFDGATASVQSTNSAIITNVSGSYVTIDFQTNAVSNVEIILTGNTTDGALKVYGSKKFKLTLNDVSIKSTKGPAINNQCKKRMFLNLASGTTNSIEDAEAYSNDTYYIAGKAADDEDRKGCLFSEANIILSGTGSLSISGNYKHGLATDGCFVMRPGATLVINKAAKNAINVKGDSDDGIGITINGGYIYANVTSNAGKCLKTDLNAVINGGSLNLNTSGDAIYDSDDNDTSSAACIKTDGNIDITGGTISCKSTGTGGKGLNADGTLTIDNCDITIATSGGKYTYSSRLTSSPKGIKTDGNITINGGKLQIAVVGVSDGSEGMESKASIIINDGELYVYAYDDAINAASHLTFNGGKTFAYAINNDGIDSNGTIYINGGLIFSSGTSSPEEGVDCDTSNNFKINGGTVIGVGGSAISPSTASAQRSVVINSISGTGGTIYAINNADGATLVSFVMPRTYSSMGLLFSSSAITDATYTLLSNVTLSGQSEPWYGYYSNGTASSGQSVTSFTSSSTITTVGQSSGIGGGGMGGGFGGGRP